jgi:antitoxin (DNA-binding transcriptional repressor) of toxin-antitoxin stability system
LKQKTGSANCSTWLSKAKKSPLYITRHGKKIARLVPARRVHNREEARAAVRRIRERAEQRKLGHFGWSEWKSYRDQGRP